MVRTTIILLCLTGVAWSGTYYVDPGAGSDENDGLSTGNAWATVTYAEQTAANGSTVYLMGGTYGAITINRAGQSSRASWSDAITFTPYSGDEPNFTNVTITGDYDRYLIFDGIDVNYPDEGQAIGTLNVVNIPSGGYVKWLNATIFGALQRDAEGDYCDPNSTTDCFTLGNYSAPGVRNIYIDDCEIGYTGQIAIDVKGTATGEIVVTDCTIHDMGMDGIRHDRKDAVCRYERNTIYRQVHVYSSAGKSGFVHGSGIAIFGDNCEFRRNQVYLAGTSAGIRIYQGAAGGGYDGGVEIAGAWDDAGETWSYGEEVVQEVSGATGKFEWMNGSGVVVLARATDGTTFNTTNNIVSSENALAIWVPSAINYTRTWGGRTGVVLENNLLYWRSNNYYTMESFDCGPGCAIVNNTIIGSHVTGTTGWNYFRHALNIKAPLYYAGDIADMTICNNLFVGNVETIPADLTFTGNIMYGWHSGGTQAALDVAHAGNEVWCSSPSTNTDVEQFIVSGNTFVGGSDMETYGFQQPADDGDGYYVAGAPVGLGYCWAPVSDANLVGFASVVHAPQQDLRGYIRDASPDGGAIEFGASPPRRSLLIRIK